MVTHDSSELRRAHDLARAESRQLAAEIDAFEGFSRRVRALAPEERATDGGVVRPQSMRVPTPQAACPQFRAVAKAYRQTVLAVDHWEDAYGESTVEASVAAEFSSELATLLTTPGPFEFTPAVKARLLEESEQAVGVRRRTRTLVDAEVTELARLRRELPCLATVADRVSETGASLEARQARIRRVRTALERLLDTHQSYLRTRPTNRYESLVTAVYAGLDVHRYPGLSTIACHLDQLLTLEVRLWATLADEYA